MNHYRIDWDALVDRTLLRDLAAAAGVDPVPRLADVKPVLACILAAGGGWPYATARPSVSRQRDFAKGILADAFARVLGPARAVIPGFEFAPPHLGMRAITTVSRIELNRADAATVATIPGMTAARAAAIVEERRRAGAYGSLADLTARVSGIGPTLSRKLAPLISFAPASPAAPGTSGAWEADLRALMAQEATGDAAADFLRVLDRVAVEVAATPHPHTRYHLPRPAKAPAPLPDGVPAQRVRVLSGHRYYYLLKAAIDRAQVRVDVVMFHIALPTATHPTKKLLDALVAAHTRGVQIRVLVDRDRADDPYRSVVINAAAIRHLLEAGVAVRVDARAQLLHSKLVVIDAEHAIIGSHNWSAGSYFSFDDLSVHIVSSDFATQARARFDSLWRRATRASSSRAQP